MWGKIGTLGTAGIFVLGSLAVGVPVHADDTTAQVAESVQQPVVEELADPTSENAPGPEVAPEPATEPQPAPPAKQRAASRVVVAAAGDPVAVDDAYTTPYATPLVVAAPGVLANDTDADGDALTAHEFTGPAHGTLSNFMEDGSFTYTPDAGFSGTDTFMYYAWDDTDASTDTTVTITVLDAPSEAPVANPDTATTDMDRQVGIDVVANDTGDGIFITGYSRPANGSVITVFGSLVYSPDPGFHGVDVFEYTIEDSTGRRTTAEVTVTVEAPPAGPADPGDPDPVDPVPIDTVEAGDPTTETVLPDTGAPHSAPWLTVAGLFLVLTGVGALRRRNLPHTLG